MVTWDSHNMVWACAKSTQIKASKENTTILCFNMLKQHMIHPRHIKQSQLFITSHATGKNTKHKAKTISSMAWQTIATVKNELVLPHKHELSYSFPNQTKLFENQCMKEGVQPIYSAN